MIETSAAYKDAVVATVRKTKVLLPIRIISPNLVYDGVTCSQAAPVSVESEIHNSHTLVADNYASLERGRWVLDGSMDVLADDYSFDGEVGYVSEAICDENGDFSATQTVILEFSGVSILQSAAVIFPDNDYDGVAKDFTISVLQGETVYYSESFVDNTESHIQLTGFYVNGADSIKVDITSWTVPYRRARIAEIYPGYLTDWTENDITSLEVKMRVDFSNLTVPYGSAVVDIDNTNGLFDPRNKAGLFQSLEERQPVPVKFIIGGEEVPAGVYYQHDRGWSTNNKGATIRWSLVDIVGLLVDTTFAVPATLPTTLEGWVAALCASIGDEFSTRYSVDANYAALSMTVSSSDDVEGESCSEILKWICQMSCTFARADAETGYLAIEPYWSEGNEYTLDNINDVPTISANKDLSSIVIQLSSGDFVVSGNTSSSSNSVNIDNPFIHSQSDALTVAQYILKTYGGNQIKFNGRGDPSSELGDVATIQLDSESATSARMKTQFLSFKNGALKDCQMEFLQSDGTFLYENMEIITENGTWTAPAGVSSLYVIIVGGGQAGGHGERGTYNESLDLNQSGWYYGSRGDTGDEGAGAKIWYGTISINDGQTFAVNIGSGGVAGNGDPVDGGDTTFGAYSSANGRLYSPSFTDISSGNVYGRSGVSSPQDGTGDGGAGGTGGSAGAQYWERVDEYTWRLIRSISPGQGKSGVDGASGCVVVYWNI